MFRAFVSWMLRVFLVLLVVGLGCCGSQANSVQMEHGRWEGTMRAPYCQWEEKAASLNGCPDTRPALWLWARVDLESWEWDDHGMSCALISFLNSSQIHKSYVSACIIKLENPEQMQGGILMKITHKSRDCVCACVHACTHVSIIDTGSSNSAAATPVCHYVDRASI